MSMRISKDQLYQLFYQTLLRAVQVLPPDVKGALQRAFETETSPIARLHLETFMKNAAEGEAACTFVCPDTGWTIFYTKVGDDLEVEGGLSSLKQAADQVVARLSEDGNLRPTLADPLTRVNLKNNVGDHYPNVEIFPDGSISGIQVTAVPKGGGSEISGTYYKMLYPSDGLNGVIHFVTGSFLASAYSGKTCPPNIIGVGIGGTADMCMAMAKRAAVLRPVGDRHHQPEVAKLELDLLAALNDLGLGPMGSGGQVSVLDVHVDKALVHTGALPVAFSSQCSLCRRATGRLSPQGEIEFMDDPHWRES